MGPVDRHDSPGLDPMDRIHSLGGASVPFQYDLHVLIFSDDAVGLSTSSITSYEIDE